MNRLTIHVNRMTDLEVVGIGVSIGILVVAKTVNVAEIIGISPVIFCVYPIAAIARCIVVANFEASTRKGITV